MWICSACNEEIEDQFDSCWKCGAGRDGSPPGFGPADQEQGSETFQDQSSLEDRLRSSFSCSKCDHQEAVTKRISVTGSGLSKMMDIQHNNFIALTCTKCGYTEFYDPAVLGGNQQLGTILDILFGG